MVAEIAGAHVRNFPRLSGDEAIFALFDFIDELEEQRGKELTERQTAALTIFAKGLISSIKAEIGQEKDFEEIWLEKRGPKLENVTLEFLREIEIRSDTEGKQISDLAQELMSEDQTPARALAHVQMLPQNTT